MELTSIQREILLTILNNSSNSETALTMKAKDIAQLLDRHTGTIRNQMQTLLALGLVESIPGPNGGYLPTMAAYEQFGIDPLSKRMVIQLRKDDDYITMAQITEVTLITINSPNRCNCHVKVVGDLRVFSMGDIVRVGPISANNTMVYGTVYGKDELTNTLLCSIIEIVSVPTNPLKEYMRKQKIMIFDEPPR